MSVSNITVLMDLSVRKYVEMEYYFLLILLDVMTEIMLVEMDVPHNVKLKIITDVGV